MTKQYFKWFDANNYKPEEVGEKVLLKIQSEDNPVVGYWTGECWEVCTQNLYIEESTTELCAFTGYSIKADFYDSEVVAWMYIDMEGEK